MLDGVATTGGVLGLRVLSAPLTESVSVSSTGVLDDVGVSTDEGLSGVTVSLGTGLFEDDVGGVTTLGCDTGASGRRVPVGV